MLGLHLLVDVLLLFLSNEGSLLVEGARVEDLVRVVGWLFLRVVEVMGWIVLTFVEVFEVLTGVGAPSESGVVPVVEVVIQSQDVLLRLGGSGHGNEGRRKVLHAYEFLLTI